MKKSPGKGSFIKMVSPVWILLVFFLFSCSGEGFKLLSDPPPFVSNEFSVSSVESIGNTVLRVSFNRPLDSETAYNRENYTLDNGLSIIAVNAGDNSQELIITTGIQDTIPYKMTVVNVLAMDKENLKGGQSIARFLGKDPLMAAFTEKPQPFSNNTSFHFSVGGNYAEPSAYRFFIKKWNGSTEEDVAGAVINSPAIAWPDNWSGEIDAGTTIDGILPNTLPGQKDIYRIYVIARDEFGIWQDTGNPTMYEWSVDNASPEAAKLTDKPSAVTNFTAVSISAADLLCSETGDVHPCNESGDIVFYKYALSIDGGAWSPADWDLAEVKNASDNIILTGLEDGKFYAVRILASDFAGNWQVNSGPGDNTWYGTHPSQEHSFQVDLTDPVAAFVVPTLPPTPNNSLNTVTIQINTADAVGYKYKLTGPDNDILTYKGQWSPELDPATTDIFETNLASAGAGSYTLSVIAKDSAGNWQETPGATIFTWGYDPNEPTAELDWNGSPPNFRTTETDFTITVGGVGITSYKYDIVTALEGDPGGSCVGVNWAIRPEIPVNTDMTLNASSFAADRNHTLCVIGKNSDDTWQQAIDTKITKRTWAYDISAPTASVSQWVSPGSLPADTTLSSFTFIVGGSDPRTGETPDTVSDVVEYRYKTVTSGDCTGGGYGPAAGIGTAVTVSGLPLGTNSLCLLVRDTAGNWQEESNATKVDINIFGASAPVRPSVFSYPPGSPRTVPFTWTNPGGVTDVRIQVATDPAFTSIVPGYTVGRVLGGAEVSHNYPYSGDISPSVGNIYYARIRIKDSLGNWSQWGSASEGVTITGGLTGVVKDVNNVPVNGATVELRNKAGDTILATTTSNASGVFTFDSSYNIPITSTANGYQVAVSNGAEVGNKTQLAVFPGVVTDMGQVFIVDPALAPQDITGKVSSAEDGTIISLSNVTLSLYKWDGTLMTRSYVAEAGGIFRFSGIAGGSYYIVVQKPGYYNLTTDSIIQAGTGEVDTGTLPICPVFYGGSKSIKVVLTWGNQIDDLDLHVIGPRSGGGSMHVYSLNPVYDAGGVPLGSTQLAIDNTLYYGPEVINFRDGFLDGVYKFSVQKFSQSVQQWNNDRVKIYIYAGDYYTGSSGGLYTVTTAGPVGGTDATWKAFTLEISGTSLTVNSNSRGSARTEAEFLNLANGDVSGTVSYDPGNCGADPVPCTYNDLGLTNLDWTW